MLIQSHSKNEYNIYYRSLGNLHFSSVENSESVKAEITENFELI